MIEQLADRLIEDVVKEGKLTKEMIMKALSAAEDKGYCMGHDEGWLESESYNGLN